jgi:hypothetical protein
VSGPQDDLARQGAPLEEAAAALAAIERYRAERAAPASPAPAADAWTRAARLEAVGEADCGGRGADPHPWGRRPH